MKKTQVALAALALVASTAALADVTMSGQIDLGLFHTSGYNSATLGNGKVGGGTFVEQGGMMDHSSVTLTASEDLGGGMKVSAVLETGFSANGYSDNGGTAGNGTNEYSTPFNRQSYLSLAGEFGTIGLGKQLSPFILHMAMTNGGFGSFWVPRLMVGNQSNGAFAGMGAGLKGAGFFVTNSVMYTTPSLNGFTLSGLTTTSAGTQNNILNEDSDNNAKQDKYSAVSLSGNVGPAYVSGAWSTRGGDDNVGYRTYSVGATLPVGDSLSFFANYMNDRLQLAAGAVGDSLASYAIGGKYSLTSSTAVALSLA